MTAKHIIQCLLLVFVFNLPQFAMAFFQSRRASAITRIMQSTTDQTSTSSDIVLTNDPGDGLLKIGELRDVKFERLQSIRDDFAKYRLECTISEEQLDYHLQSYMKEVQKRKVSFKGFRVGKIPPDAMRDVRRFVVDYGVELTLKEICAVNGLTIYLNEAGEKMLMSNQFNDIILPDSNGKDYVQRRDSWFQTRAFPFTAEFYAKFTGVVAPTAAPEDELTSDPIDVLQQQIL